MASPLSFAGALPRARGFLKSFLRVQVESLALKFAQWLPLSWRLEVMRKMTVIRPMDYSKKILLRIDSDLELRKRVHSCEKEPEMIQWLETSLRDGDVFYDIGANVGAYSLVAASQEHVTGVRVLAFEPAFLNFNKLCLNVALNRLDQKITCLPVAIGAETKISGFNLSNLTVGAAFHSLAHAESQRPPAFRQGILSVTLDDLVEKFGLPAPQLIKIDVDGLEREIVLSGPKTLRSPALRAIMVEVDEANAQEKDAVCDAIIGYGFQLTSKHRYVWGNASNQSHNYLFERTSPRAVP